MLALRERDTEGDQTMSVIAFPVVSRRPRAVADTPATVAYHPRSIGELAAEAIEKIESDKMAEQAMAEAHHELDVAVLKLTAKAIMHERQTQAITMVMMALERMRYAMK